MVCDFFLERNVVKGIEYYENFNTNLKGMEMKRKGLITDYNLRGVTIGGGGGQPIHMVIISVILLVMVVITLWDNIRRTAAGGLDPNKKIPFKCTNPECGAVIWYTIAEVQKMYDSPERANMAMMGPLRLDCPKCGKKNSLVQAVQCPKCGEVFIIEVDRRTGKMKEQCPKCGAIYSEAIREEYLKKKGKK